MLSTKYNSDFAKASPDERDIIFDKHFSETFGALLKKFEKQVEVPKNIEQDLAESLKKRNWLVHDYFYERAGHLLTRNGRNQMLEELTKIYEEFDKLDHSLDSMMDSWRAKAGLTDEVLEHHMSKLRDELNDSQPSDAANALRS